MNYYNEWDKGAAAWLRELIKAGLIPNGYVDDRSIAEVTPSDLEGFTQCHFFAGIGGWSYALQLAGVPATTRLWTGSPPCQPFSVAGKQLGQLDERHLAPTFMRLVAQCRPPLLFGEQVAAAINKRDEQGLYGLPPDKILDGISEIFGSLPGWTPPVMQRMPKGIRERLAQGALRRHSGATQEEQAGSSGVFSAVPLRESGKIPHCRMSAQVCAEGCTVRSGPVRSPDSREDGERAVRAEQNTVRPDITEEDSVHAVSGQDRSGRAVHDRQCEDSLLGHQCTTRGLGRTDGIEALLRLIDEAGTPNSEREIAGLLNRAVEVSTGSGWLDDLFTELEAEGYACGAAVLPAASVGAPHKRDRLFFGASLRLGDASGERQCSDEAGQYRSIRQQLEGSESRQHDEHGCADGSMADANDTRPQGRGGVRERTDQQPVGASGVAGELADAVRQQFDGSGPSGQGRRTQSTDGGIYHATNPYNCFWSNADWLGCRDGKFRPVESGSFPLAHGIPARVGRLRGYGNAIVPQIAAEFIKAFMGE